MSRSNPTDHLANPAVRWHEWNGELGVVRYYDKDAKKTVDLGHDFVFLLLDEMASVRGWHEQSQSGIFSNEVRDTRQDVLLVKAYKEGTLAEGLYKDIKDRVAAVGGQFVANCYIAFKNGTDKLQIGSLRFKGAALGAWMEFRKSNRAALYKQAIQITGYTEGKKGRVIFRVPTMKLRTVSDDTNAQAVALDQELQQFLTAYLTRTKRDQVETVARETHASDESFADRDYVNDEDMGRVTPPADDDIPF